MPWYCPNEHISLAQSNETTRGRGAFWKRKFSHFLRFIAPKKSAVILQDKDHETNAQHPSYMVHTLGSKESLPSGAYHVSVWTTKTTYTHKNNGGSTSQTEHIQN